MGDKFLCPWVNLSGCRIYIDRCIILSFEVTTVDGYMQLNISNVQQLVLNDLPKNLF